MPRNAIPKGMQPLPHSLQRAVKDMTALRVLSFSQTTAGAEVVAWEGVEAGREVGVEAGAGPSTEPRQESTRKLISAAWLKVLSAAIDCVSNWVTHLQSTGVNK